MINNVITILSKEPIATYCSVRESDITMARITRCNTIERLKLRNETLQVELAQCLKDAPHNAARIAKLKEIIRNINDTLSRVEHTR